MQLVAYGAQDIYLTGNPQITFFKVVYRRHTNFSMEAIQQTLNGSSNGADDTSSTCTISRNGDLVYKVYVSETDSTETTNGSKLVKEVELEIGGQRIDKHTTEWMNVWTELSTPESKAIGLKSMQCDIGTQNSTGVNMTQIPLQFWFCRNPGLALPLIALQYHEVKLKFTWGMTDAYKPQVWCDYIYLDTDERRRFAQVSHEYLIEQLQEETMTDGAGDKKLNFNHPVKELIWVMDTPVKNTKYQLKLNGHDRFAAQGEEYFQLRQPYDYHTAVPKQNLPSAAQISLLDRQIELSNDPPSADAVDATTGLNIFDSIFTETTSPLAGGGGLGHGQDGPLFIIDGNQLHIRTKVNMGTSDNAQAVEADLVGSQLAMQVILSGNITGSLSGRTYFANVTGVGGSTDPFHIILSITPFVSDETIPGTITAANTVGPGAVVISRVANGNSSQARTSQMVKKINVYSFALKPEEHQPSGTCNFSRIDNAQLNIDTASNGPGKIYAVNYNVLRIMSGMGGLAYSN